MRERGEAVPVTRSLPSPEGSQAETRPWSYWIVGVTLIVAGMLLRVLAARGDLWLDEIWSMNLASRVGAWHEVFTSLHIDNNHYLTTLWMHASGGTASERMLRLPSLAGGAVTMTVILLRPMGIARREAIVWLFLTAFSPLMIQYDSEARGYGLAVASSVSMVWMVGRYLDARRRAWLLGIGLVACAGLLAHLTFIFALMGALAWASASWWRQRTPDFRPWGLMAAFMAPCALLVMLWGLDLRHMTLGGGPGYLLWTVLSAIPEYAFGLPHGLVPWLCPLLAVAAGVAVLRLASQRKPEWLFFATILCLAPMLVLVAAQPRSLAPRHFMVAVPFLLLLASRALSHATRGRVAIKLVAGLAFLLCTSAANADLLTYHRGSYRDAVAYLGSHSPPGEATLDSDQDFMNLTLLAYYLPRYPATGQIRYLSFPYGTGQAPFWFLQIDFAKTGGPHPLKVRIPGGQAYRLEKVFPHGGLSGWDWILYRRI